ncbi:MAG: hypothetical protein LAN63_17505 [Acidobacteriia bacterium]|nr:hypothetical protein [Terriglobia bacterium]
MLVLILAVASFLLFLGIGVLLWLADTLESREIRRKRTLSLQKPLALLSIIQAYDPIYAVLWEAPISALELIESGGGSGIPVARLRPSFDKAAACFPEIYEGCSFVQWLRFLEETHLISWDGYRVLVTAEGKAFLKYRFVTDALVEA